MRYAIEHRFDAPLQRIEALLDEPDFYARMARSLPSMEAIEVLSSVENAGVIERRVRYTPRPDGRIPSYARGVITPEMLIWIEESRIDRVRHRIDYRVLPNIPRKWQDRFESTGSFVYRESEGRVERRVEGEVIVRVPILGRLAERLLVREVERSFDAEAKVLSEWLSAAGA